MPDNKFTTIDIPAECIAAVFRPGVRIVFPDTPHLTRIVVDGFPAGKCIDRLTHRAAGDVPLLVRCEGEGEGRGRLTLRIEDNTPVPATYSEIFARVKAEHAARGETWETPDEKDARVDAAFSAGRMTVNQRRAEYGMPPLMNGDVMQDEYDAAVQARADEAEPRKPPAAKPPEPTPLTPAAFHVTINFRGTRTAFHIPPGWLRVGDYRHPITDEPTYAIDIPGGLPVATVKDAGVFMKFDTPRTLHVARECVDAVFDDDQPRRKPFVTFAVASVGDSKAGDKVDRPTN